MPIIGGILRDGTKVETEKLLSGEYENPGFPLTFIKEALKDRPWDGRPHVTGLLVGTREQYLKYISKYFIDLDKAVIPMAGTRFHSNMEDTVLLTEIGIEIDGVQGTLDLLEELPNELNIVDYKLVGSFKMKKWFGIVSRPVPEVDNYGNPVRYKTGQRKGQAKMKKEKFQDDDAKEQFDYTMQINIYRVAVNALLSSEMCKTVLGEGSSLYGKTVDNGKIFFALRDSSLQHDFSFNSYYETCEKLPDAEVKAFIKEKATLLKTAMVNWEADIESGESRQDAAVKNCPGMCSAKETWDGRKCEKYCDVREACKAMQELSRS
jgi:hypothetical protein